jgi:hypothetical protein
MEKRSNNNEPRKGRKLCIHNGFFRVVYTPVPVLCEGKVIADCSASEVLRDRELLQAARQT